MMCEDTAERIYFLERQVKSQVKHFEEMNRIIEMLTDAIEYQSSELKELRRDLKEIYERDTRIIGR